MRTLVLAALLLAAVPSAGIAAPCVPDSLAGYIALGAGGLTHRLRHVRGLHDARRTTRDRNRPHDDRR
jgi:hypothetical protein